MRSREALGPGSLLSQRFARYEDRPGQVEMAEAVEAALAAGHPLFVEAGTGTGKTLAYLVPAVLSGKKIVVSTATKALQEQIVTQDVPLVEQVLGRPVKVAMMKGLANYVCRRRLSEALLGAPFDPVIARVAAWAERTVTGDRSDADGIPEDDPVWREVAASTETRLGAECRQFDACFVTRMRKVAEDADLIVVNHHLLFADLALRAGRGGGFASVIPEYDAVVLDEAHQIEDIATDFFGSRVSSAQLDTLVRDAVRALARGGAPGEAAQRGRAIPLLDQAGEAGRAFFRALEGGVAREDGAPGRRALLQSDFGDEARRAHGRLDAALEALLGLAESLGGGGDAAALIARRAGDLRADLRRILAAALDEEGAGGEPTSRSVGWIDVGARTVSLGVSPIDLGATLRRTLFDRGGAVVCTSATLATSTGSSPASFHFARARLGAPEETRELVVPSPFDFRARALLYLPSDLPDPKDPSFDAAAAERVLELVRITGGGAFVLCTSTRAMRRIHEGLRGRWSGGVFVQGEAPKPALLQRFRDAGDAVLVATMSFWEGVDVPGRALRLVILDKIPFAVPTDPVVAARAAEVERQGGSAFAEYVVPTAAITLKQGFGRLIRSRDDAGVVAILDRRIVVRGYGRRLVASLPPARRVGLLDEVRAFWGHLPGAEPLRTDTPSQLPLSPAERAAP